MATQLSNLWKNTNSRQKFTILSIPVTILAIIIFSIIYLTLTSTPDSAKHITIENFHEIAPNVPDFYRNEVQSRLWQTLVNTNSADDNTFASATIRDGSYQETPVSDDITGSEFLVDIPNLQQSFSVSFNWYHSSNPDEYDITITCPYYTDVIYQDTYCQTSTQAFDELYRYLPSGIPNTNAVLFANFYDVYSPGHSTSDPYLSVTIGDCSENLDLAPYQDLVKNWLLERYVNPEKIDVEYSPYCATKTIDD